MDALGLSSGCSSIGGTSGATPHVGGALALIYSAFSGISPEDAYLVLVNGALDAGDAGPDNTWGFGKLRIFDSINWEIPNVAWIVGGVTVEGDSPEGVRISIEGYRPVHTDVNGDFSIAVEPGSYFADIYKYGQITRHAMFNVEQDSAIMMSL